MKGGCVIVIMLIIQIFLAIPTFPSTSGNQQKYIDQQIPCMKEIGVDVLNHTDDFNLMMNIKRKSYLTYHPGMTCDDIDKSFLSYWDIKSKDRKGTNEKIDQGSRVIYVPDDYPSIQSAIDNATDGDLIIVRDGTYKENLFIDKSITIRSENGNKNCTIRPRDSDIPTITIYNVSCNIIGFKIRYGEAGILMKKAFGCNISDNIIRDNIYDIRLFSSFNNTIYNNTLGHFWSWDYFGVQMKNSHHNVIKKNTIKSLAVYGFGIHLINSTKNLIVSNYIYDCNYGMILEESSTCNTIVNNTLRSNFNGGINLYDSDFNLIIFNNVTKTEWGGVYFYQSNNTIFRDNTLSKDGLMVYNSYRLSVENNTVNGKPLKYLENEKNKIIAEDCGEIILINCKNITVIDQDITGSEYGIELWNTSNSTISNCSFSSTLHSIMRSEVYLAYSNNNLICGNTFNGYLDTGVKVLHSCGNEIFSNTFVRNDECVHLVYSYYNKIHNNTIVCRDTYGIVVSGSDHNLITYNDVYTVLKCHFPAISISKSKYNYLTHNYIHNNSVGIEIISEATYNNIIQNVFYNNTRAVALDFTSSHSNVSFNWFFGNFCGVDISESRCNRVTFNHFFNNSYDLKILYGRKNRINHNNFLSDNGSGKVTFTYVFPFILTHNNWNGNYWGRKSLLPKIIWGILEPIPYAGFGCPWANFDFLPAPRPYDIPRPETGAS